MTRGELWWTDLGIPFGSEPGYRRPVLIIQNDLLNLSKLNTAIIVPLSSNLLYADAPGNLLILKEEAKLSKDSVILFPQIRVIDRKRLVEKISKLSKEFMIDVENSLLFVLGIYFSV
ncbi:MAG: type II toxin-antitoxin system PemK/MazF family toxin [Treponema sp.]|nr:type II toxin-antitoxin system PemK/MazF family toxin [Treponema sp.]